MMWYLTYFPISIYSCTWIARPWSCFVFLLGTCTCKMKLAIKGGVEWKAKWQVIFVGQYEQFQGIKYWLGWYIWLLFTSLTKATRLYRLVVVVFIFSNGTRCYRLCTGLTGCRNWYQIEFKFLNNILLCEVIWLQNAHHCIIQ